MNAKLDLPLSPHSTEAEQSVLGGLLLDNDAHDKIGDILTGHDFYSSDHRHIYESISSLIEQGKPADIVTVAEALEAHGKLNEIGGIAYLGALAQNTPGSANIRRYAEIVHDKTVYRGLMRVASDLLDKCMSAHGLDVEQIASQAESEISRLTEKRGGDPVRLKDLVTDTILEIEKKRERGAKLSGLASGFSHLDQITGGFEPGQLIIVAARPSVGKTIMGCNLAFSAASQNAPVLFFTLEMTSREIAMRVLASQSGVPMHAMRTGTDSEEHWNRLASSLGIIDTIPLVVDDRPAATVSYVRSKAKKIKRQGGLGLVVIDYLQLMRGVGDNRTQEIGSISRSLKALAKELKVPIVAMAQLNRGVEGRHDKRPLLSDLRDSGEVEQDADIVIMLHREEIYNPSDEWNGLAEVLVRKNRNGVIGEFMLCFDGASMQFSNYSGLNVRRTQTIPTRRSGFE